MQTRYRTENKPEKEDAVTFLEFLKQKKGINTDGKNMFEFMDDYYDEYLSFLRGVKDGCGPK